MEHVSVLIFEHVCCSLLALPCHSFSDSLAFRLCFDEFCTSLWLLLLLLVCGCLCCFLFVSLAFRLCRHSKKPCFGNCDPYKWQQQHSVCSRCVTIAEINKRYNVRAFGKCRLVKYLTASSSSIFHSLLMTTSQNEIEIHIDVMMYAVQTVHHDLLLVWRLTMAIIMLMIHSIVRLISLVSCIAFDIVNLLFRMFIHFVRRVFLFSFVSFCPWFYLTFHSVRALTSYLYLLAHFDF